MRVLAKIRRIILSLGLSFLALFSTVSLLNTPVFAVDDSASSAPTTSETTSVNTCQEESGSLGWLVCPATGFLSKVTDGLYEIIEEYLVIKPITSDADSPFRQIWSIFRDITNIVFVIFFLVVIYSQLTGIGISNYGIKRALPKVVVAAIMINLSYILCALFVDFSNIIGSSVRDIFLSIETSVTPSGLLTASVTSKDINYVNLTTLLGGGTILGGLAIGLAGGFAAVFLALIPVLLGGVVAVLSAYVTLAVRQALIYLLVMVSPLAFVSMMLPNTEIWYKKWKSTLTTMLVFYPLFAALFGACSLVGWTIMASAESNLILVLGMGVKVVPLIFSWKLLQMSGTLPGQVNTLVRNVLKAPTVGLSNAALRESAYRRAKYMGVEARPTQPSRYLAQYLKKRVDRRAADTADYEAAAKLSSAAYTANYRNRRGYLTSRGLERQRLLRQNVRNQELITKTTNDFEEGVSATTPKTDPRYQEILDNDLAVMNAADRLVIETARGEMIARDNAASRHARFEAALTARTQSTQYNRAINAADLARYNTISSIMHDNGERIHYAGAYAANAEAVQDKIITSKFANYFASIPPTQELVNRLKDLNNYHHSNEYIDTILMGMRTLNQRGDTDLVKATLDDVLSGGQIRLGTHASQAIANFLMFDVKDNDPFLRRYGKYINLETARVFNEGQLDDKGNDKRRKNNILSFDEYVKGEYEEVNPETGTIEIKKSKRGMVKLMEGTSLDGVERTAYDNILGSLKKVYGDDTEGMAKKLNELNWATLPAFISAALKYPSGSEQIQSQAAYLTGLKEKNGKWVKRWEDPDDPYYGFPPEFFEKQTDLYVAAQTPNQILNLRTDLFSPMVESFANERIAELIASGELPENYADGMSDQELKEFRESKAKEKFQGILNSKGKLEQIYKSRRSGAALGSKDSLRRMLDLDDDVKIAAYIKQKAEERRERQAEIDRELEHEGSDSGPLPIYDNAEYFRDAMHDLFDEAGDSANYPKRVSRTLRKFGLDYCAYLFDEFLKANPSATNDDLFVELMDILDNPDNYR